MKSPHCTTDICWSEIKTTRQKRLQLIVEHKTQHALYTHMQRGIHVICLCNLWLESSISVNLALPTKIQNGAKCINNNNLAIYFIEPALLTHASKSNVNTIAIQNDKRRTQYLLQHCDRHWTYCTLLCIHTYLFQFDRLRYPPYCDQKQILRGSYNSRSELVAGKVQSVNYCLIPAQKISGKNVNIKKLSDIIRTFIVGQINNMMRFSSISLFQYKEKIQDTISNFLTLQSGI